MIRIVPLLLLASCTLAFSADMRTPTASEWIALDKVATNWDRVAAETGEIPTLTPECFRQHRRTLVLVVDDDGLFEQCGYCAPNTDDPERCDWGNAAGCLKQRSAFDLSWPIVIAHYSAPTETLVAHEAVHAIAHCLSTHGQPTPHANHQNQALWGPTGVFPL